MQFTKLFFVIALAACNLQASCIYAQTTGTTGGPGWSDALPFYNRGNRYMSQGRYEDALRDYQEAVAKCDSDSDFFVNLGTAYEKCSDYPNAQKAFEKAINLNKDDWSAYNNLANSLTKQDRLGDAVKAFEEALKRKPPAPDVEAINKDIGDIKKIMEAKGMSTTSGSKPVGATTPQRGNAKPTTHKTIERARIEKAGSKASAPVNQLAPVVPAKIKSKDWGY